MIKILIIASSLLTVQMASAQTCKDTIPASTPDSRYIVNGDEVTDTRTGLIWQRCSFGQTGNDCSNTYANTYTWQEALQAASAPWRLPNINELRSIVEEKCHDPAINLTVFPNESSQIWGDFWSSSSSASDSSHAWHVEFGNGASGGHYAGSKSDIRHVRLVRDAQ